MKVFASVALAFCGLTQAHAIELEAERCPAALIEIAPVGPLSQVDLRRLEALSWQSGRQDAFVRVFDVDGIYRRLGIADRLQLAAIGVMNFSPVIARSISRLELEYEDRLSLVRHVASRDFASFLKNWRNFELSKYDLFNIWVAFGPAFAGRIDPFNFGGHSAETHRAPEVWAQYFHEFQFDENQRLEIALALQKDVHTDFYGRFLDVFAFESRSSFFRLMRVALRTRDVRQVFSVAQRSRLEREDWFWLLDKAKHFLSINDVLPQLMRVASPVLTREDRLDLLVAWLRKASEAHRRSILALAEDFEISHPENEPSLRPWLTTVDHLELRVRERPDLEILIQEITDLSDPDAMLTFIKRLVEMPEFPFERLRSDPGGVSWMSLFVSILPFDWRIHRDESPERILRLVRRFRLLGLGKKVWPSQEEISRLAPEAREQVRSLIATLDPASPAEVPDAKSQEKVNAQKVTGHSVFYGGETKVSILESALDDIKVANRYGFSRFDQGERVRLLTNALERRRLNDLPQEGFLDLPLDLRLPLVVSWLDLNPSKARSADLTALPEIRSRQLTNLLELGADPLGAFSLVLLEKNALTQATPAATMARAVKDYAAQTGLIDLNLPVITTVPNTSAMLNLLSLEAIARVVTQAPVVYTSPVELAAQALGFAPSTVADSTMVRNDLTFLLTLAHDFFRLLGWQGLKSFEIDPRLFNEKKYHARLVSFLGLTRDALALTHERIATTAEIAASFGGRLKPDNLDVTLAAAKRRVVTSIESLFGDASSQLTYEDLARLQTAWGDLESIYTLLARYNDKAEWRKELPILSRIFNHSLADTFTTYKFRGDPTLTEDRAAARRQLQMLDDEKILILERVHSRVAVFDGQNGSGSPLTSAQKIASARSVVLRNLIPNLDGASVSGGEAAAIATISDESAGNPLARARMLATARGAKQSLADLASALSETEDIDRMIFLVKTAQALIQKVGIPDFGGTEQTRRDLSDILDHLTAGQLGGERAVVFTTTVQHPKSYLATGDLVQAASCQNFRYGSMVHTLPGYVIDANVLVSVGYALTPGQFKSAADFEALFAAWADGLEVQGTLDEITKIIQFRWTSPAGEQAVSTRAIPYAHHRQVIKVGAVRDNPETPALFAEPAYTQSHFAREGLARETSSLILDLARQLGAEVNVPTLVYGSRNPSGHYTDAGGGQKVADYVLLPGSR